LLILNAPSCASTKISISLSMSFLVFRPCDSYIMKQGFFSVMFSPKSHLRYLYVDIDNASANK
jgi:hypothetical protein